MNIGVAVEAIKAGKRVRCLEWDSTKKFIFMQVPSTISKTIVPKMQSLPEAVKAYFNDTFESELEQIDSIYYHNQLAIVGLSNLIEGYNPTSSDLLSENWIILD
jgi:hypothetical protein